MSRCRVLIAGPLLALLVSQVPNFLQLTLTPDAVLYDVQARCLLEGGVLYRDVLEPNLPGIVWVHAVVRSVAGWSAEVLRSFDLCVVVCSCSQVRAWGMKMPKLPASRAGIISDFSEFPTMAALSGPLPWREKICW